MNKINFSKINLSIDTEEDLFKVKKIFKDINKKNLDWLILTKKYLENFSR